MKPKLPLMAAIACALLALTALLASADTARADFNPTYEISVGDARAGSQSAWTSDFSLPEGNVQFGGVVFFIPPEWEIAPGEESEIGAVVGRLTAQATLGIINGPCKDRLPVEFVMVNASTDVADTVNYLDDDDNGDPDYFEDKDNSGLKDGIEKYPDFITRAIVDEEGQPQQPIRRAAGITIVAGTEILLQFLVFEPGTFIDEDIPNDAELGYPTVTLLQNAGDPDEDPIPGAITDFCTPLTTTNVSYGFTRDNTCTDLAAERLDPLCDVSSAILLECDNLRDDDGDQIANDGCPTVGDEAETNCEDQEDDDGDGWVNDGCPAIEEPENSTPTEPDESGVPLFTNPEEGTYTFTTIAAGQRDADGDGYENSLDTCPFDVNEGDPRVKSSGDLDDDGLDAACDPNDNETNSDQDLDGYTNRQDNCPLVTNGEFEEDVPGIGNQRDTDDDAIGDACDPNPEDEDTEGELILVEMVKHVTIGPGGPPTDETPEASPTPGDDEEDDGGGTVIVIIIVVIVAVVVLGGGAFFFMRRRGA